MTQENYYKFACPQCETEDYIEPFTRINVSLDPKKRQEIEDFSIFEWTCPNCSKVSLVLRPCLYHDSAERFMVWFSTEKTPAPSVRDFAQLSDYTLRYTDSPNAFREKVNILERHLDDRAVELTKLILYMQLNRDGMDLVDLVFHDLTSQSLVFVAVLPQGEEQQITMSLTTYEKLANDVREILYTPTGEFLTIDLNWAKESLELFHSL